MLQFKLQNYKNKLQGEVVEQGKVEHVGLFGYFQYLLVQGKV
jgi:hypothetical protein